VDWVGSRDAGRRGDDVDDRGKPRIHRGTLAPGARTLFRAGRTLERRRPVADTDQRTMDAIDTWWRNGEASPRAGGLTLLVAVEVRQPVHTGQPQPVE
jgi:hypothetical protein